MNTAATEECDALNLDEDCDGLADDDDSTARSGGKTKSYPDADADGYGDETSSGILRCDPDEDGYVLDNNEWIAKNPVRGDRQTGSFSVSLLTGKWNDFADGGAKGGDLVGLLAYLHYCKQWQAAQMIDSRLGLGLFKESGQANTPNEAQQAAIEASIKRAKIRQQQAEAREKHDRQAAKQQALIRRHD